MNLQTALHLAVERQHTQIVRVSSILLFHAFVGNSQNYPLRCCGRPDALWPEAMRPRPIVDQVIHGIEGNRMTVASIRHEIVVLLPNQCKSKFTMLVNSPFSSDIT